MKHFLITFTFLISINLHASNNSPELCNKVASYLKEGDIVFLDIDSFVFEAVAAATQTWTSHVGIATLVNNQWVMVESTLPTSRKTPLCDYLDKTQNDHFAVRRLKGGMSPADLSRLKSYLDTQMGILYDTGFDYNSTRLYCSKLVYQSFYFVLNKEIGSIKAFQKLLDENPQGDTSFWKWWFLGSVPWERLTVTPKDQLIDSDLETVVTWENL
ncbi:MAG: hypothetical protein K2Q26_14635 [Bdellovibrionales bacterium]|nr:hypothetical protein [Bdellovibrionales bacterium]